MEARRLIFHIDVNSAFLSWESVYRLSLNPDAQDLRLIPSAVGGDVSSRHGIILAKSTPAKKSGVVTAETIASALRKCPELIIVPSRFDIYSSYSRQMLNLLSEYTPDIEKFSIDEAFLDMTETIHLFGRPNEVADQIRERIRKELKFTVNVGISCNKLLAKMASDFEKPDKTHTLFPEDVPTKMWPLPLRDLLFVGKSTADKMARIGLHTIGDAAACDPGILKAHLGEKYGIQVHRYANGIDHEPVAPPDPTRKGYGNSITLPQDVSDFDTACQVLLALSETVGARLREAKVRCNSVTVELKDWKFACQEFWNKTPVRLIGLRTTQIQEETFEQISLFEDEHAKKMRAMEKAVDAIRGRYGIDSVQRASFLKENTLIPHAVSRQKHLGKASEQTPGKEF